MDWLVPKDNVELVSVKVEVVGYHKIQGGRNKMSLRKAERIHNRIEKFEKNLSKFQSYIVKVKGWIESDIKLLNKELKELSQEDFDKFSRWYNG